MRTFWHKIACVLIALGFSLLIWQLGEVKLADFWARASVKLSGNGFQEVSFFGSDSLPKRFIPGVGKVPDPLLQALESYRLYKTRVEPARLEAFLKLSEHLENSIDPSGRIPQAYDFRKARLAQPWYNSATQAASAVALAARAGYLRSPETFQKARIVFSFLIPGSGSLSSAQSDGSVWYWEYGPDNYSLKGMIQTLLCLHEYHKIVGDTLAAQLFNKGVEALNNKLPELQTKGWLDDKYYLKNQRSEHLELTSLLSDLNAITPDSLFTPAIAGFQKRYNQTLILQLIQRPSFGRIIAFAITWLLIYLISYAFLKPHKPRSIAEENPALQ